MAETMRALGAMKVRLAQLGKTLKLRIALVAGLLVFVGVWISTAVTLAIVESHSIQHLINEQQDSAQRSALQIAERIAERRNMLVAFARGVPPDIAERPGLAARILGVEPLPRLAFESTLIARSDGGVVAMFVDGEVRVASFSLAERDFFGTLVRERRGVLSTPIVSRATGQPAVAMVEPVFDDQGRLSAVVGATLHLSGTSGLSAVPMRANAVSRAILIDRNHGTVIGHDTYSYLLRPVEAVEELAAPLAFLGKRLRGNDLVGAGNFGKLTIGWAAVPDTDWTVFEVSDTDDLTASLRHARVSAIGANVTVAAFGALLMFLVAVRLFRSMGALRTRAARILTEPDNVDGGWPEGRDEVGELSRVLQHVLRERAAAEQGSLRLLGQVQAIMDNASVAIGFTRNDRFELVSKSMTALTGYSVAELFGKPMALLSVSPKAYEALKTHIASQGGRFDSEFPIRRKDGARVWVRAVCSAVDPASPGTGMIWIVEDATERRRLREQLSWSATRDPLTELLNRREFEARLAAHIQDPNRPEAAVLFLDLDRFKVVNDTGGHGAGDRLLCALARLIERQVRRSDYVARLGGDEFAVLLVGCPLEIAMDIAERIRFAVSDYRLEHDGRNHSVGASVGVVSIDSSFGDLAAVLKAADEACYAAKRSGRDSVRQWDGNGSSRDVPSHKRPDSLDGGDVKALNPTAQ
jgi:diguanylate cyclase (GGDEF)-like protein/PAS domain S-box-containing protein